MTNEKRHAYICAYMRAYRQQPGAKEKERAYRQRPNVKAKRRALLQRPEIKAKVAEYQRAYMRRLLADARAFRQQQKRGTK